MKPETQQSIALREDAKPRTGAALIRELARRIKTETARQYQMLGYYAGRADDRGTFCVSVQTVQDETGHSKATIGRINADFKAAKILSWKKGHGNHQHVGVEGKANQFQFDVSVLRTLPRIEIAAPQPRETTADRRKRLAARAL